MPAAPRPLSPNTISVQFDAPRLSFGALAEGGLLNLQFGPSSDVALDTTYLDENLRVSRGDKGNLFLMIRDDP